jgi:hypothetical protein
VIDTSKYLITQPVTRAGFYEDGSMARSVTNAITNELEKQRLLHMSTIVETSLGRYDYEKWAWGGCGAMSAAFLQSLPDIIGYMGDNMFQELVDKYSL